MEISNTLIIRMRPIFKEFSGFRIVIEMSLKHRHVSKTYLSCSAKTDVATSSVKLMTKRIFKKENFRLQVELRSWVTCTHFGQSTEFWKYFVERISGLFCKSVRKKNKFNFLTNIQQLISRQHFSLNSLFSKLFIGFISIYIKFIFSFNAKLIKKTAIILRDVNNISKLFNIHE